jgi:hypothetical protein
MAQPKFQVYTDYGQGRDVPYSSHASADAAIKAIIRYYKVAGFATWGFWVLDPAGKLCYRSGPQTGQDLTPAPDKIGPIR